MTGFRAVLILLCVYIISGYTTAYAQPNQTELEDIEIIAVLADRDEDEEETVVNPNVFVAHKQNYVFPLSYTSALNREVYDEINPEISSFYRSEEVNFQISLKVQINNDALLFRNDSLQAGLTLEAWWQLYSNDVSSPFRETNYQPEVFYSVPLRWRPFGLRPSASIGLEHQSNGQVQGLSRSWNRVYGRLELEGESFFASIQPWYRIPEEQRTDPNSADGDDNPDILDFMGHGQLSFGWRGERLNYFTNLRANPSTGNGAVEVFVSFPLFQRFRGVVQYFNGYGNSLIDYDHFQQRIGLGILLSNLF